MASLELQRHNQTVLDNLELVDMLEFKRGAYSHWAVYVGNEEVVHLSGADGAGGSDLKHPVTISGVKSDNCIVRKDNFWSVAGDSKAYKYNSKDTNVKPYEHYRIVQRALSKVGEVRYKVLCKNREGAGMAQKKVIRFEVINQFLCRSHFPSTKHSSLTSRSKFDYV